MRPREGGWTLEIGDLIPAWSVVRPLRGKDRLALGEAARSRQQANLKPRTAEADHVAQTICLYCAVDCGQRVFVKDGRITQIEGDPDSPISRGRLCPKGAASRNYVQSTIREYRVKYRRSYSTEWEDLDLDTAVGRLAGRRLQSREEAPCFAGTQHRPLIHRPYRTVRTPSAGRMRSSGQFCVRRVIRG